MGGLFEFESTDENELDGNETPLRSKKQIVDHRQYILMELQFVISTSKKFCYHSIPFHLWTQIQKNLPMSNFNLNSNLQIVKNV